MTEHRDVVRIVAQVEAVITSRHLNRVIRNLCDTGIIQKERKRINVLDWNRLDQLSNGLRYE